MHTHIAIGTLKRGDIPPKKISFIIEAKQAKKHQINKYLKRDLFISGIGQKKIQSRKMPMSFVINERAFAFYVKCSSTKQNKSPIIKLGTQYSFERKICPIRSFKRTFDRIKLSFAH